MNKDFRSSSGSVPGTRTRFIHSAESGNPDRLSRISRRGVLGLLGLMAAGCMAGAAPGDKKGAKTAKKTGQRPGIALQLYTMRDPAKKDLAGTLKQVRQMGWEYVQWSGMPALPAEEIRKALDTAGLKAVAAHVGVEAFEKDFAAEVKFWKTVGALDVAPGGMMKDCTGSLDAWLRGARRLDDLGAKLRAEGMRLSYHNHAWELEKFEGDARCKLDILFESTGANNLFAELDLAWVYDGGADPAAYIRKYRNRCPVIHAKDLAAEKTGKRPVFKPLGQGVLKWPEIFAAGREAGVEWYVYEQDDCYGDPFGCAQASHEFLKKSLS